MGYPLGNHFQWCRITKKLWLISWRMDMIRMREHAGTRFVSLCNGCINNCTPSIVWQSDQQRVYFRAAAWRGGWSSWERVERLADWLQLNMENESAREYFYTEIPVCSYMTIILGHNAQLCIVFITWTCAWKWCREVPLKFATASCTTSNKFCWFANSGRWVLSHSLRGLHLEAPILADDKEYDHGGHMAEASDFQMPR